MKKIKRIVKFIFIIPVCLVLLVICLWFYDWISYEYLSYKWNKQASFDTMKDDPFCNLIKAKYDVEGRKPMKESLYNIADLTSEALLNNCWNKSSECKRDAVRVVWARRDLYKLFPLHPLNNPDWHKWSYADQKAYENEKRKADIELLEAEDSFKKTCQRTLWSNFLDNFRY